MKFLFLLFSILPYLVSDTPGVEESFHSNNPRSFYGRIGDSPPERQGSSFNNPERLKQLEKKYNLSF